jgi:hypothetical protein
MRNEALSLEVHENPWVGAADHFIPSAAKVEAKAAGRPTGKGLSSKNDPTERL